MRRLVKVLADPPMNLPAARSFFCVPCRENVVHHFFDMIEICFRLERVVHAVVTGVEKFLVAHIGVVAKMGVARCFHQPMRHQRARRDNRVDHARLDQVAENESHLADR